MNASQEAMQKVEAWFDANKWAPFAFQREVWAAYLSGHSGLIHSATGTGKTYAAWLGPLIEAMQVPEPKPGLKVLWLTPLRALAADTVCALTKAVDELEIPWKVGARTGDTSSSTKARQRDQLPDALVTTPESLSLLLSYPESQAQFSGIRCVIVDEWHELMGTKRGVQTELALARLRRWRPDLRTWGISATLGNTEEAKETLLGVDSGPSVLVRGDLPKEIIIDTLLPEEIERFPWAGHMGTRLLPQVLEAIEDSNSCLLFTNTRSQAEIWFQAIIDARPDWKGKIELHHGSLDRDVRDAVEMGIKLGSLRAVVCTSSLDLGVDFTPVDRVLQIGSPKGVARLLQRAGRSGHQPGAASRVTCVPTFAMELVDVAGVRDAAHVGRIEQRPPLEKPLDVLAQHLVTIAAGPGFRSEELFAEVRTSRAYRELSEIEWQWTLNFVMRGGESLAAYPEFQRVVESDGLFVIRTADCAKRHRMSIGTITSDAAMSVQYQRGQRLGTVEESFIARLRKGDRFFFSGKALEFIQTKDMTAYVRPAKSVKGLIPRWMGGRLPLSTELAHAVRVKLEEASFGELAGPEMRKIAPLLDIQARWSAIPATHQLLIERIKTTEGHHLFFFPIEGRLVHEGLAALFAYRLSLLTPITFSMACNDYGFELLSPDAAPLEEAIAGGLFTTENLANDILHSLNSVEMARRQFRDVARISGLLFEGLPWQRKGARQLQASSGLFFDVFQRYDPENLLMHQATREVMEKQLEQTRMHMALTRIGEAELLITSPRKPTPLAFPILVDRLRDSVSSEPFGDRLAKMSLILEQEADRPNG